VQLERALEVRKRPVDVTGASGDKAAAALEDSERRR
jgi:hypothetical protein